jgi:hypothetical protein
MIRILRVIIAQIMDFLFTFSYVWFIILMTIYTFFKLSWVFESPFQALYNYNLGTWHVLIITLYY